MSPKTGKTGFSSITFAQVVVERRAFYENARLTKLYQFGFGGARKFESFWIENAEKLLLRNRPSVTFGFLVVSGESMAALAYQIRFLHKNLMGVRPKNHPCNVCHSAESRRADGSRTQWWNQLPKKNEAK